VNLEVGLRVRVGPGVSGRGALTRCGGLRTVLDSRTDTVVLPAVYFPHAAARDTA